MPPLTTTRRAVHNKDIPGGEDDAALILADLVASAYPPNETVRSIGNLINSKNERVYVDGPVSCRIHLDEKKSEAIIVWWQPHSMWTPEDFLKMLPIVRHGLNEIVAEDPDRYHWALWGVLAETTIEASKASCDLVRDTVLEGGAKFVVVEPYPLSPDRYYHCRQLLGRFLDALNAMEL